MNESFSYIAGATVTLTVYVTAPDDDTPTPADRVVLDTLLSGATDETPGVLGVPVVGGTPTVTTADSGVFAAATEYFYVVTALGADGESLASNEVHATIGATTSSITLTWGAVDGATSYNVYRGTVTDVENHLVGNTDATTYKDHGATGTTQSAPLLTPVDFVLQSTGIWTFVVDTTGFAAGVYTWRAKATLGETVTLAEDTFTVRLGVVVSS